MRKVPPLSGPGAIFCLLGSTLALSAYFLPYSGSPKTSLWDQLLMVMHLNLRGQDGLLSLVLLPLLPLIAAFAFWAVFFRPPSWNILAVYLTLTLLSLLFSMGQALLALFDAYVSAELSNSPQFSMVVDIGVWLLPVGLLMSLLGGIFREPKASG
jgi:hypothetical protein